MALCKTDPTRGRRLALALTLLSAVALTLGAYREDKVAETAAPRPCARSRRPKATSVKQSL